jgi:DNA polymerase V
VENYSEGRIDLNRDLIKHPLSTFYIRVSGDSMVGAGIMPGALLVVDRGVGAHDGHVVVARINDELCVKRLSVSDGGCVWLLSENERYLPIEITEEMDFEVWGRVLYSIAAH